MDGCKDFGLIMDPRLELTDAATATSSTLTMSLDKGSIRNVALAQIVTACICNSLNCKSGFLLLPRQCAYFCLAAQMALLGLFLPPYAAAGIRTHVSRTCTTLWDLNSGPLYRLSYRDQKSYRITG